MTGRLLSAIRKAPRDLSSKGGEGDLGALEEMFAQLFRTEGLGSLVEGWEFFLLRDLIWQLNVAGSSSMDRMGPAGPTATRRMFSLLGEAMRRVQVGDLDVLLASRDRFVTVTTPGGPIRSDYLLWSVIEEMKRRRPELKAALWTSCRSPPDDLNIEAYGQLQFITVGDILRSLGAALRRNLRWRSSRRRLEAQLRDGGLEEVVPILAYLFRVKRVFIDSLWLSSYRNLLARTRSRVVVANDDELALRPQATPPGGPRLVVVQSSGMLPWIEVLKRSMVEGLDLGDLRADRFLGAGERFRELKEHSRTAREVNVVGQPKFDHLFHVDSMYDRAEVLGALGLDPERRTVIWTTTTHAVPHELNRRYVEAIYGAVRTLKMQLIVKLHPAEDQGAPLYREGMPDGVVVVGGVQAEIYSLIFSADLLVTQFSTTAMEAAVLDRPVIVLNLSGRPDPVDFVSEGIAEGVYSEGDLVPTIEGLIEDDTTLRQRREDYVRRYLHRIDGRAAERAVTLILDELSGGG